MGIIALIGPKHAAIFFTKKSKIKGSAVYFFGIVAIASGLPFCTLVGFLLQSFGMFLLFKSFLKTAFTYAQTLPFIGPFLRDTPFVHSLVNTMAGSKSTDKRYQV